MLTPSPVFFVATILREAFEWACGVRPIKFGEAQGQRRLISGPQNAASVGAKFIRTILAIG
jgi:hypothetical protein